MSKSHSEKDIIPSGMKFAAKVRKKFHIRKFICKISANEPHIYKKATYLLR